MAREIVEIPETQRYWLVRTEGGAYYNDFYNNGFIAIGWDKFNDLKAFKTIRDRKSEKDMIERIRRAYPDNKRPKHAYNQVQKFITELNIGDIVVIPGRSSYQISFGRILSDVYIKNVRISKSEDARNMCPFGKRRNVEWIKTIRRDNLDPNLYKLFFSHHTISDASEYGSLIDRTLYSFYIKGNRTHLILKVTRRNQIYVRDLTKMLDGLIEFSEDYNKDAGKVSNMENVELKLNVQSPGLIELISSPYSILVILGGLVSLFGGKFQFKSKKIETELKLETLGIPGLIEKIIQYKERVPENSLARQKLIESKSAMKQLGVKLPEEIEGNDTEQ